MGSVFTLHAHPLTVHTGLILPLKPMSKMKTTKMTMT